MLCPGGGRPRWLLSQCASSKVQGHAGLVPIFLYFTHEGTRSGRSVLPHSHPTAGTPGPSLGRGHGMVWALPRSKDPRTRLPSEQHWGLWEVEGPLSRQPVCVPAGPTGAPAYRSAPAMPQGEHSGLVLRLPGSSQLQVHPREGSGHPGMLRPAPRPGRTCRPPWELVQLARFRWGWGSTGRQGWLRPCHRDRRPGRSCRTTRKHWLACFLPQPLPPSRPQACCHRLRNVQGGISRCCHSQGLWGGGRPAPIWQESHFLAEQGRSQLRAFGRETKYILICNGVSGPSPPPPASHTSGVRSEG